MTETKEPNTKKPSRYLVVTPKNDQYAGKTFGLQFSGGKALLDEALLPKHLFRTMDDVVKGFQDMPDYELTPME